MECASCVCLCVPAFPRATKTNRWISLCRTLLPCLCWLFPSFWSLMLAFRLRAGRVYSRWHSVRPLSLQSLQIWSLFYTRVNKGKASSCCLFVLFVCLLAERVLTTQLFPSRRSPSSPVRPSVMSGAELALGILGLASTATIPLVAAAAARLRKSKYTFLDEREPVWRRFLEAWDSLSGTFEEIQHALPALERNPQGRHLILREIEKATKVFADVNRHLIECKPLGKVLAERERWGGGGSGMEETRKLVRGMREGEKGMRAALEREREYVSGCEKCRCQSHVGEMGEQEWMRRKLEVMERNERLHRLEMEQARRDLYDLESAASREGLQMARFLGAAPGME